MKKWSGCQIRRPQMCLPEESRRREDEETHYHVNKAKQTHNGDGGCDKGRPDAGPERCGKRNARTVKNTYYTYLLGLIAGYSVPCSAQSHAAHVRPE